MNTNLTHLNSPARFERQVEILRSGFGRHLGGFGTRLMKAYPACDWSLSITHPHHEQGEMTPT
jgi:hypothetical protein